MLNARLKRITAAALPMAAVLCALPLATASAQSRHNGDRRDCGLNAVVVRGEVSGSAASGASSFTATVWSARVSEIRTSDEHRFADDPTVAAACASATGTSTSGTTTTSSTTTCPAGTSSPAAHNQSFTGIAKGITINTGATTKVTLNGASSAVGSLAREDHFVALFIVPSCAGNGSNSGIPAMFLAAWTPGHDATPGHGDRHGDDWETHHHHRGDHGHRGDHPHRGDHRHRGDDKFKK